jgi:putative membrane protein
MITRERENWLRMLFIWQGSVLHKIWPRLLILLGVSIIVYHFHGHLFSYKINLNPAAFTLVGIALAIFLGFCNSAAYDRYWEGRKLWGSLIINTRSVVRQVTTYLHADKYPSHEFAKMAIAFSYALKHQLRKTDATPDIERLLPEDVAIHVRSANFKPVIILREMASWIDRAHQEGHIDSITKMGIDANLDKLSDIVGGCERIANNPIPFSYYVLLHRTVYIFCFLLPFGLVDSIGWMTPVIVMFIGYTFMALDAIVDEISEPFGTEPNDLALNSMCITIEHSLSEMVNLPIEKKIIRAAMVVD